MSASCLVKCHTGSVAGTQQMLSPVIEPATLLFHILINGISEENASFFYAISWVTSPELILYLENMRNRKLDLQLVGQSLWSPTANAHSCSMWKYYFGDIYQAIK